MRSVGQLVGASPHVGYAATHGRCVSPASPPPSPCKLATVASIHSCTSRLISRTSRPAATIGRPMTTRIVPGFFISPRRGQKSPALWATGIMSLPVSAASNVPLTPYRRVCPGSIRVPSGKIMIQSPSAMRCLPCSTTWPTAECPDFRSIAMACSWRMPQPTKGTHRSSRFNTHTWRGKTTAMATVSQDDECFHSAMWLSAGMFSAPSIR